MAIDLARAVCNHLSDLADRSGSNAIFPSMAEIFSPEEPRPNDSTLGPHYGVEPQLVTYLLANIVIANG